jgi:hypothetical protein
LTRASFVLWDWLTFGFTDQLGDRAGEGQTRILSQLFQLLPFYRI